jgi:hypothetical protein
MPNWNPSFPDQLGNEFLFVTHETSRVATAAPARAMRMASTTTETVTSLKLSAEVNPLLKADGRTVIDVIEEGAELTPMFETAKLVPSADVRVGGWRHVSGSSTNLWSEIDGQADQWPAATSIGIVNKTVPNDPYEVAFDASMFGPGGSAVASRVGFVGVRAILGVRDSGWRKLAVEIVIDGVAYPPHGGSLRNINFGGALHALFWGEFNPATNRPWTPADIAKFGPGGGSKVRVTSQQLTSAQYPVVAALSIYVAYLPVENRAAVGVWRRPVDLRDRLVNVTTDALYTYPAGTSGWSKQAGRRYLYVWRQASTPALWGPVIADDVRWAGLVQDLGSLGQPRGRVYPLTVVSPPNAPSHAMASDPAVVDVLGAPAARFAASSPVAYAVVPMVTATPSVDSQPYRLDLVDLDRARLRADQSIAQRVVPASAQSYAGVRLIIAPPISANATLTVAVRRVSDGVQMGGTFTATAAQVRALPALAGGKARYVFGLLSVATGTLAAGTAYAITLTTTAVPVTDPWFALVADASLGPAAAFGGGVNGVTVGAQHFGDRTMAVTLVRQPDTPTSPAAVAEQVPISTVAGEVTTVPHVRVSWTAPATPLGAAFARTEIERSTPSGWELVATILDEPLVTWLDREVARNTATAYRVRAVAKDGRTSPWAASGTVTVTASQAVVVLTSNQRPELELVHLVDRAASYPLLGADGAETVAIHGRDYQVVFTESENRGVGWTTNITVSQLVASGPGGRARFDRLVALARAVDIPYVCAMDHRGTKIYGHLTVSDAQMAQPADRYTATIDMIPTTNVAAPVEVDVTFTDDFTMVAMGTVGVTGTGASTTQPHTMVAVGTA